MYMIRQIVHPYTELEKMSPVIIIVSYNMLAKYLLDSWSMQSLANFVALAISQCVFNILLFS